ncbi:hypothetical protein NECAME_17642 [Necator americanus]|uniref:Uncharacterized protein n=1 Tax=Necator americanus TaxID=51031 RepID=W2TP30_NECAM|nr:hypothetical protein NECAME_17642 [Necator americanus]ETN82747.1 hypothetical protein NECAME_17642 [Necator americanus]
MVIIVNQYDCMKLSFSSSVPPSTSFTAFSGFLVLLQPIFD